MADAPAAPAAPAPAGEQQQQQQPPWTRFLMPFVLFLLFNSLTSRKASQTAPPKTTGGEVATAPRQSSNYFPMLHPGDTFDVAVSLSVGENTPEVIWRMKDVVFDSNRDPLQGQRKKNASITISPEIIERNLTLVALVDVFRPRDLVPVVSASVPIIIYKKRTIKKKKNLLATPDASDNAEVETPPPTELNYTALYKPTLSFCLVEDWSPINPSQLPPQLGSHYIVDESSMTYKPILFVNEFWLLDEHLIEINASKKGEELTLELSYDPIGLIKWQMLVQMEQSFATQASLGLGGGHDEIKRMLLETNPYLLGLTFAVTMLHSIFDILAFKNDIAFWRNKQDMKGLSVKSIMVSTVCQLVIFLYLLDSETSWVVILSSGAGVLIEAWKIKKACNVTLDRTGRIPKLRIMNKESYTDATKKHDDTAVRYMGYALAPCVIGYAIYSVIYQEHKSWYSFVLNTLVGFIYTFGFIMMTPQLFINYKLKSVAHLPWKTFTYKALNTFIDDMFAFIIKMPTLHRLSCFRDDIIFFIYLYQRWIYPVDKSRVNEFGQRGDGKAPGPEEAEPVAQEPAAIQEQEKKDQ
eukprot:TRINITY_DN3150_c0_g1_i1.p1 TRINITY_DN3150_c0_g1~~TRINITY_DN3150_c0_g1_i1.p1  ORF type:complete len:588 (+),score=138.74 TRINITY_DN3150_c0_g1_i1:26-1765(+)